MTRALASHAREFHSAIVDASIGSASLHKALHTQFLIYALKHRISLRAAEICCANSASRPPW